MSISAVAPDPALRHAILDAARAPVVAALGKPVRFRVTRLKIDGDDAFLLAALQDEAGAAIDYAGTPLAEAAREGFVSRDYAALLRRTGGVWSVVAKAVGPTDVAWASWSTDHRVAAALFEP